MLARQNPVRQRAGTAQPQFLPAPVGGWNARDAIVSMPQTDAIELENLFPDTDKITIRDGYTEHATGVGSGAVEFLHNHTDATNDDLLAAGGGQIYDVTGAGAGTSLASGFTSNRWQAETYNGRTIMVNGDDTPQSYDGATVGSAGFSGTGLTVANLINVAKFTQRLYLVEKNTGFAWYGGSGAVTGALTKFDVGQFARGGFLVTIGTWSRDAGEGVDDYIAFIFSTGEILVYQGTDPATDFALVGSFMGSEPIGRRCLMRYGGELVIITRAGYVPLSFVMSGAALDQLDNHPIWGKIRGAARNAALLSADNFGWEAMLCATGCAAYFNVPLTENSITEQHVLNVITGAWTKYNSTEVQPITWSSLGADNYVGATGGKVFKLTGGNDNGVDIIWLARTAFGYPTQTQRSFKMTAVRPVISLDANIDASLAIDTDFATDKPQRTISLASGVVGAEWDTATWDEAEWASDPQPQTKWFSASGEGHAFSTRLSGSANGQSMFWFATQFLGQPGGLL